MILLIPSTGSRAAAILIHSVKLTEDEEGTGQMFEGDVF